MSARESLFTSRSAKREAYESSGLSARHREANEQRRRERSCFWTWPIGHLWHERECVNCGKQEDVGW